MRITIKHLDVRIPNPVMQPAAQAVAQSLRRELERGAGTGGPAQKTKEQSDG